jgi:hypothetical protein
MIFAELIVAKYMLCSEKLIRPVREPVGGIFQAVDIMSACPAAIGLHLSAETDLPSDNNLASGVFFPGPVVRLMIRAFAVSVQYISQ